MNTLSTLNTTNSITLITATQDVGKIFTLEQDGSVSKQSNIAIPIWKAHTINIPSLPDLQFLLEMLTSKQALILDYIPNVEGEYWLISKQMMDEKWEAPDGRPVRQLTKSNFHPSGLVCLDWDYDPTRPSELCDETYEAWWARMVGVEPSLAGIERLVVPSSSSRVLTADGSPVYTTPSYHTYCKVGNRDKIESIGQLLDAKFWLAGQGYERKGKGGAALRRTPFDPCTFSISRRVFESAPIVGDGLRLNGWDLSYKPGSEWDLNQVTMLTDSERDVYKELTSRDIRLNNNGRISVDVNAYDLVDDLVVVTKDHGEMTIRQYRESDLVKIRCQTPFRESDSWAAYLNRHDDGSPFLYDVGDGVKHHFKRVANGFEAVVVDFMGDAPDQELLSASVDGARKSYEQIMLDVAMLSPTDLDGYRQILRDTVWLERLESDQVLKALKAPPRGFNLSRSREMLESYIGQLVPMDQDEMPGPVFRYINENGLPRDHVDNMSAILTDKAIKISYNVMTHNVEIAGEGLNWLQGEEENQQIYYFRDLCVEHSMPYGRVGDHMCSLATNNIYHPALQWLSTAQWDGVSRFEAFADTIKVSGGEDMKAKRDLLLKKWLLSAMACLKGYTVGGMIIPPRGVLCFVGRQYAGKTTWLRYLTGPVAGAFGDGVALDVGNKDSVKEVISHWICELGEIDTTFSKSSISHLKAFISRSYDNLRLPYAPKESKWQRRTVFAGTVNSEDFLRDTTGNSRYWPVAVEGFDLDQMTRMNQNGELLQMWKEIEAIYDAFMVKCKGVNRGEDLSAIEGAWWLSRDEMEHLEMHNERFREISWIEEVMDEKFDWQSDRSTWVPRTVTQVARDCGLLTHGSNELRGRATAELRAALAKYTGEPTASRYSINGIQGRYWTVPPIHQFKVH